MEESACPDRESDPLLDSDQAVGGSRSANADWIAAVLAENEGRLIRYAEKISGDLDFAREVVQETFLRLCRQNRQRFTKQDSSYLTKWLFTVCRNLAIDELRRDKKMSSLASDPNDPISVAEDSRSPHQLVEQAETEKHVSDLIDDLPMNQQEVLRLKFQNGLSYKQIAEVTGHTVSNVGFMLHSAIKKLRERIQVCTDS